MKSRMSPLPALPVLRPRPLRPRSRSAAATATATVKAENQSEILKQAAEKKSAEIILEVSKADSKGADSVQLSLDVTFVKNVADKTNADLTVNTENGKVTLDQETIKTVLAEAKGATITLEVSKVSKPTEVQKKAAGANGHLLKLTIKSGDKVISDFNKGKVKVVAEIVSKLLDKKVAAIHIADDGKIEQLAGKVLTIGGKKYYEFTTPHFSTFALVDADELGLEVAEEPQIDAKALTAKLTPVARSAKTAKKNVKVTRQPRQAGQGDHQRAQRRGLYRKVPLLSFDEESRRLQGSRHEKDRFLHQYQRQERHEILLQGSGQSLRRKRQARREDRTQAVQIRKQNLDEREIKSGQPGFKSSKPDYPDT